MAEAFQFIFLKQSSSFFFLKQPSSLFLCTFNPQRLATNSCLSSLFSLQNSLFPVQGMVHLLFGI